MRKTLVLLTLVACAWAASGEPLAQRHRGWVHPAEAQGFNPQPDPPARPVGSAEVHGFNPQPDPPGRPVNPGEAQGFNPQPDPPARPGLSGGGWRQSGNGPRVRAMRSR